jgi:gas vesicle protein GvpA/GvpJ/GvpM family
MDALRSPCAIRSVCMPELQRAATSTSIIDVLDHILDKGIVIDAWVRVSVVGIDLVTVEARVVVASIDTYMSRADALHMSPGLTTLDRPMVWQPAQPPPDASPVKRGAAAADLKTRKR